jgi:predicted nucleic acid-binding protein
VTRQFVDTNVFLRFLTNNDEAKARRAEALFRAAVKGKVTLVTGLLVLAEIIWTLESFYGLEKQDIASKVEKILNTPNLECADASLVLAALEYYVHDNIDFVDAYNGLYIKTQDLTKIYTYDRKDFARLDWLEVVEP